MEVAGIPGHILEVLIKYAEAAFPDGDLTRAYSPFYFTVENNEEVIDSESKRFTTKYGLNFETAENRKVEFIVTESFVDHGDIPF